MAVVLLGRTGIFVKLFAMTQRVLEFGYGKHDTSFGQPAERKGHIGKGYITTNNFKHDKRLSVQIVNKLEITFRVGRIYLLPAIYSLLRLVIQRNKLCSSFPRKFPPKFFARSMLKMHKYITTLFCQKGCHVQIIYKYINTDHVISTVCSNNFSRNRSSSMFKFR